MTKKERSIRRKRTLKRTIHALLIGFAIVAFWRGVWGLLDLYLFSLNRLYSALASLLIGIALLYSTKNLIRGLGVE